MSESVERRYRSLGLPIAITLFLATFSRSYQVVFIFLMISVALTLLSRSQRNRFPLPVVFIGLNLLLSAAFQVAHFNSDWTSVALTISMMITGVASVQLLRVRGTICVFLSVVTLLSSYAIYLGLFQPQVGLVSSFYEAGSLQGPLVHRNLLGMICALGVALAILALKLRIWDKRFVLLMLSINISALIWTRSMNSTLAALAVFVLSAFLNRDTGQFLRKRVATYIFGGLVVFLPFAIAGSLGGHSGFFGLVQRDETFTGRTLIWQNVISELPNVLPFGEGWNRLWQPDDAVTQRIWGQLGFPVFHSHQAFLDLLARGGLFVTVTVIAVLWMSAFIPKNYLTGLFKEANLFTRVLTFFVVSLSFGESFFHLGIGGFVVGALSATIHSRKATPNQDTPNSLSPASPSPGTI